MGLQADLRDKEAMQKLFSDNKWVHCNRLRRKHPPVLHTRLLAMCGSRHADKNHCMLAPQMGAGRVACQDNTQPPHAALLVRRRFDVVVHFAALKAVGESVEKPLEVWGGVVPGCC